MFKYTDWIDDNISTFLAGENLWLVTGAAGFIGSHLVEALLTLGQRVRGVDNFATGSTNNLNDVRRAVGETNWRNFEFIEQDITDFGVCIDVTKGVSIVLHQAALGSVPRSITDPLNTNATNISGFLNMIHASHTNGVRRFVYAASSSTYGDNPNLPKIEDVIGNPLSPYAVTKFVNELYSKVFALNYGFGSVGLRYFNVFGPRQDPNGAYAAVIPRWIQAMMNDEQVSINGDGQTSRDFCFVANVVQANIKAAFYCKLNQALVCNVACGQRTSLNELSQMLRQELAIEGMHYNRKIEHRDFRRGDVKHSLADIGLARAELGYSPTHDFKDGLRNTVKWYVSEKEVR